MTENHIPNDIDAERATLGSLLIEPGYLWPIRDILTGPESFQREHHGLIYQAMINLDAKGATTDFTLLCGELSDMGKLKVVGEDYVTGLLNATPTSMHAEHYARVVETKYQSRRLIQAAGEIAKIGYEADDSARAHALALEALHRIAPRQKGQGLRPVSAVINESIPSIQGMIDGDKEALGLSTGFIDLDRAWGGMQRGKLVLIAGRPGMGKSTIVECFAYNAAKAGANVLFFSAEMASDELIVRMACRQAGIDSSILRAGKLAESGPEDTKRLWQAMREISALPLWIDDQPGISTTEIRLRVAQFVARHRLDLILVDYIQRLGDLGNNEVLRVGNMAQALKNIGRTFVVPVVAISQLSRACELRSNFRPRLSDLRESGCVAGDTRIALADGSWVPIANLVGQSNVNIIGLDEELKINPCIATKVFRSGKKQTFLITLASRRVIKATANHKFLTIDGWERLDTLKPRDRIATPSRLPETGGCSFSDDELILLAHLVGDGSYKMYRGHAASVRYASSTPSHIAIVSESAKRLFAVTPKVYTTGNCQQLVLASTKHPTHREGNPVVAWLRELGIHGQGSHEKYLPETVMQGNCVQIALFLRHLWATDGSVWERKQRGKKRLEYYVDYATTSIVLARQVQHLLLRLGIVGRIHIQHIAGYRPCYRVSIYGATDQLEFFRQVGALEKDKEIVITALQSLPNVRTGPNVGCASKDIWKYINKARQYQELSWSQLYTQMGTSANQRGARNCGISQKFLRKVVSVLECPYLRRLADSDIFWDEIISIEPLGVEDVYDATVAPTHNFIAEDIIVHNSLEQEADNVTFLYRHDYYVDLGMADEDPKQKNICVFNTAKNRGGPTGKTELVFIPKFTWFLDKAQIADELERQKSGKHQELESRLKERVLEF